MATPDPIQTALLQFLASDNPGVIALKGAWGVGKTYYWHDFVGKTKTVKNCVAYSYVSLFGIGSIAELRRAIFARQTAGSTVDNKLAMVTRKVGAGALRAFKASVAGVENTDVWADVIEDKTLQKFLVCIDDLERREEDLSASALLGFIASLRDERKCKVVLLYNDDEIDPESEMGQKLAEYREKVIDRELTFQPTVARSYALVFGEAYKLRVRKDTPSNSFHPSEKRSLLEIFETAKTANIRVMRRAKDLLDYCAPHMVRKYPNLWPSFARQVVKVCCLHFVHGRDIELAMVTDAKAWAHFLVTNREKKEEAKVKKYHQVVGDVGYFPMRCDAIILEYLKFGFVEWEGQAGLLKEEELEHVQSHLGVKLRKTWDLIWNNFTVDQATFCREMNAFIAKHGKKMNLGEISQAVDILREFESSGAEAEALLAARVGAYVNAAREDATMHLNYGGIGKCAADMVRERVAALAVTKPLAEAAAALTRQRNSYNPSDVKHLQSCTAEEFYDYMKSSTEAEFLEKLEMLWGRFGDDDAGKAMRGRFEQALERLARESKINARRVRYGVKFQIPGVTPE